jgi:hypothetical protein
MLSVFLFVAKVVKKTPNPSLYSRIYYRGAVHGCNFPAKKKSYLQYMNIS